VEQSELVKLIPLFLLVGMFAMSGCSKRDAKPEPFSAELVRKAEAGDPKAQFDLGWCYDQGTEIAKDLNEAVKWYTKAAEQGNAFAVKRLEKLKSK